MAMKRHLAGILVFSDVEVLDFCGPFEVFSCTRLDESRRRESPSPFDVRLVAEDSAVVTARGGLQVLPHHSFADCPDLDIVVVPGGYGVRREIDNSTLTGWIARQAQQAETITSVCTGAMLLGRAGLLDGRTATTHWQTLDWMRETFPRVTVDPHAHVVEDGAILTSAGISAGIDMALRVVARYCGEDVARRTARYMEYPYPESLARRIGI
jgi:transcriptional regulator GlxA family with amidase domain